jgi:formylglycine-generating enzyme required for sulfatase activity
MAAWGDLQDRDRAGDTGAMRRSGQGPLGLATVLLAGFGLVVWATACNTECVFDTDCEGALVCGNGRCVSAATDDLALRLCSTGADCSPRERCRAGLCELRAPTCTSHDDCPTGEICEDGSCQPAGTNGGSCPTPPPPDPCEGHTGECPCIAGNYRFLPSPATCPGMTNAAVTILQNGCNIALVFGNNTLNGSISPDGTVNLLGDVLICEGSREAGSLAIELNCSGCIIDLEPFLPPPPSVEIPAGTFMMGTDDASAPAHEKPLHPVNLSCFRIDAIEITNRLYHQCAHQPHDSNAVLCGLPIGMADASDLLHSSRVDRPVRNVRYADAQRFCEYLGGRLPTEAQWEKAARGSADARAFPWGDDPEDGLTHCAYDSFADCPNPAVVSATHLSNPSPYGVFNMAGNVRNWTRDAWSETPYAGRDGFLITDPEGPDPSGNQRRVVRGGSYLTPVDDARVHARSYGHLTPEDDEELLDVGFRCVRERR